MTDQELFEMHERGRILLYGWSTEALDRFMVVRGAVRRNALGECTVDIRPHGDGRFAIYASCGKATVEEFDSLDECKAAVDEALKVAGYVLTDRPFFAQNKARGQ